MKASAEQAKRMNPPDDHCDGEPTQKHVKLERETSQMFMRECSDEHISRSQSAPVDAPSQLQNVSSSDRVTLQFLCTNDTHSQMEPFVQDGYKNEIGGVARRAAVFAKMREQFPASLTLDAGDMCVGQPYFNFFQGEVETTVLAALGYDAAAIGNHDFDAINPKTGESGLSYFQKVHAKHAPNVKLMCANVVDERSGATIFPPHSVFQPHPDVRVGVVSVLGEQAWNVIGPESKLGLQYRNWISAAKASAEALLAEKCDIMVCLSHTGIEHGDRELAKMGLFDVIFSGHEHWYDTTEGFEEIQGRDRLCLLSKGFALGGGICCARLAFDKSARCITHRSHNVILLDAESEENSAIAAMIAKWKADAWNGLKLNVIVGKAAMELPLPSDEEDPGATFSHVHAALHDAARQEFLKRLHEEDPTFKTQGSWVVITNRYSAASGLKAGTITRYDLVQLIRYNSDLILLEISGRFLDAIVRRNARFVGSCDFLFLREVSYTIRGQGGKPLPPEPLTKEQLEKGVLECVNIQVAGQNIDIQHGWYWCLVDGFVLNALLAKTPEREGGIRNENSRRWGFRDLIEGFYMRDGSELRS